MAVNLSKNRLALLTAYQDVIDEASSTDWALYMYDGDSNDLTLAGSGGGGLPEITASFDSASIMYGFCSLKEPNATLPRYVFINWVGEDVPDARKCVCASHVASVAEFFQGVDIIINASSLDDMEPSAIGQRLTNGTASVASPVLSRLRTRNEEHTDNVGTSYQKTNAEIEMKKINREEFWEQAKREEEMRKEEERKKVAEERQRFEEERMELERKEQEDRERRYREREQQIEEHRKKMQEEEEETRERTRNQTLLNEPSADDSSLDKKESEVEEAAAIIAQRADNPLDFFKKKEKAMSCPSESSPTSTHRTGRLDSPFLKQQQQCEPSSPQSQPGGIDDPNEARPELYTEPVTPTQTIPMIVTTPIQEEDHSQNVWDPEPEPEQHPPVQESAPNKPIQSVAPQAREVPEPPSFQQDHDLPDFPSQPAALPQQETDSLLDLWETPGPAPGSAPSQNAHLMDLMGDPAHADVPPSLPQPLLAFDDLPEPPISQSVETDDPSQRVELSGPHEMTLSYQHALMQASVPEGQDLDHTQLLMTNGEALIKEGAQASEGYFSQSQEEEFAQAEDSSAKVVQTPVFYNKPPEIDITCWDTDPVLEDDD